MRESSSFSTEKSMSAPVLRHAARGIDGPQGELVVSGDQTHLWQGAHHMAGKITDVEVSGWENPPDMVDLRNCHGSKPMDGTIFGWMNIHESNLF